MRLLAVLAAAAALSSCGLVYKIDVQQGNYVPQEQVEKLRKGMTKAEVRQLLGTPLLTDIFHANRWDYYFSSVKDGKAADRTRLTVVFQDDKVVDWTGTGRLDPPKPAAK